MKIKNLVVVAVLATAILSFGFVVTAQTAPAGTMSDCMASPTVSCLTYWLGQTNQQLSQLKNSQGTTTITAPPTNVCHTFNTNLGYANSGSPEVGYLHTVLDKEGISYSPDTGNIYGESTMSGVIQFQQNHGVSPLSGYVGPATRSQLNSLPGCSPTVTVPPLTPIVPPGQPRITVTSPNNGSVAAGSSTTVAWYLFGSNSVSYYTSYQILLKNMPAQILGTGGQTGEISYNLGSGNTGGLGYPSFTVQIPSDATCPRGGANNCGLIPGTYYIEIDLSNNSYMTNPVVVTSNAFTVTASNSTQSTCQAACTTQTGTGLPVAVGCDGSPLYQCQSGQICQLTYSTTQTNNIINNTLSGSQCVTPPSSTQPTITITSPNEGEQWQAGTTHNITWTSTGIPTNGSNIYIALINDTLGTQYGITTTIGNSGSYSWAIPSNPSTINGDSILGSKFKISATYSPSYAAYTGTSANYFSIVNSLIGTPPVLPTAPKITVTSPAGGETWKIGETHNITWTSAGLPANAALSIGLNGDGTTSNMAGGQIATNILASTGYYSWVVPSYLGENLAGKKYSVYASCTNCGSMVGYASQNYFTIAAASTPLTSAVTNPYACAQLYAAWAASFKALAAQTTPSSASTQCGMTGYNPAADMNNDGYITATDYTTWAMKQNPTPNQAWCQQELSNPSPCNQTPTGIDYCSQLNAVWTSAETASSNPSCGNAAYYMGADANKDGYINSLDKTTIANEITLNNQSACQQQLTSTVNPCATGYNYNQSAIASISGALNQIVQEVMLLTGK